MNETGHQLERPLRPAPRPSNDALEDGGSFLAHHRTGVIRAPSVAVFSGFTGVWIRVVVVFIGEKGRFEMSKSGRGGVVQSPVVVGNSDIRHRHRLRPNI